MRKGRDWKWVWALSLTHSQPPTIIFLPRSFRIKTNRSEVAFNLIWLLVFMSEHKFGKAPQIFLFPLDRHLPLINFLEGSPFFPRNKLITSKRFPANKWRGILQSQRPCPFKWPRESEIQLELFINCFRGEQMCINNESVHKENHNSCYFWRSICSKSPPK